MAYGSWLMLIDTIVTVNNALLRHVKIEHQRVSAMARAECKQFYTINRILPTRIERVER